MDQFKVLFWNVWCLPKYFTDGKYNSDERAKLISQYLDGYDLVLLCEAWTECAKAVFLKTYPYHYTDNDGSCISFGTGLMVLSKYEILNPDKEIYSKSSDFDWFSNKGIFHFQIKINQKLFDFFLTHMQATYNSSWSIFNYSVGSQTARLYQSLELVNFVNKKLKTNTSENVWLIGDFNMFPYFVDTSRSPDEQNDDILRSASYEMIKSQVDMTNLQTKNGAVYRFFTRRTNNNNTTLTYMDSHGLTDGPSVLIKFDI